MKIKQGNTRTVFLFKYFVVKIPNISRFIRLRRDYLYFKKNGNRESKMAFMEMLLKHAKRYYLRGVAANKIEIISYRKYKPSFMPKVLFNIGNFIVICRKIKGKKYNPYNRNSFIKKLTLLDKDFQENWSNGVYNSHDIWTEDWLRTNTGFILLDFGGNFATLLCRNKTRVEQILKNEFEKAAT